MLICKSAQSIQAFLSIWTLWNQKVSVSILLWQSVICISSIRICSPCNRTPLETGYFTKALTGMSYLRKICINSDMTRQFKGTKVDFMKPGAIKPLGTAGLIPCLQSSQQPHQVSKECHSLVGAVSGRGIRPKVLQACLMASTGLGFWPGEATKSST